MPKNHASSPSGNRLLQRLPKADYDALLPRLQQVSFRIKQILYEAEAPIDYAYFPTVGVLSAVTVMDDGSMIEVATVGKEGHDRPALSAGRGGRPPQADGAGTGRRPTDSGG